jgi:hypothetical protein
MDKTTSGIYSVEDSIVGDQSKYCGSSYLRVDELTVIPVTTE